MAIAWWIDTGVHFKVAADIRAEYVSLDSLRNKWQKPKIRDETKLGLSHVAPSIIIFGVATFFSIIAFAFEIVHHLSEQNKIKKKRRMQMQLKRTRGQPKKPTMNGWVTRTNVQQVNGSIFKDSLANDMTKKRGMKRKQM